MSISSFVAHRGATWRDLVDAHLRKFLQYSGVSMVSISLGQALLFGLNTGLGMQAWLANVIAVFVSAVPAYLLYRYVVWAKHTPNDIRREIVPFLAMAFAGLVLSTIAVWVVDRWWGGALAVNAAYLGSFGVLWVFKYVVLERWLFGPSTLSGPAEAAPLTPG